VVFVIALLLAVFVLPAPWGLVAVVAGAVFEIAETGLFIWWSKRRRTSVGVETLVGRRGVAVGELSPEGQVKVDGEIWRARSDAGRCAAGTPVVVRSVEGLTLVVDPA
jgi:membrane protein implicated in regulation of membrane protease activity